MSKLKIDKNDNITIIPDPEFELAKDLFLKSYKTQLFLNDQSLKQYQTDINNALETAKLFVKMYEDSKINNCRE